MKKKKKFTEGYMTAEAEAEAAAEEASKMRKVYLERDEDLKTSPRLVLWSHDCLKRRGKSRLFYQNMYARKGYGLDYKDIQNDSSKRDKVRFIDYFSFFLSYFLFFSLNAHASQDYFPSLCLDCVYYLMTFR